jgi:hypothetical protein
MIKYTELDNGYVMMDNDGVISTIPNDPANSDYQAYLNPVEHLTEIIPADEA